MKPIRWLRRRLSALLGSEAVERELSEELRHHIELEAEELLREGWDPEDARREAFRRFGGEERTKERVREGRRGRWLGDLSRDLRYAARNLRRTPGFTTSALMILALGIGGTTALFSLVDAVLLSPLPYAQPDQLVQIWERSPQGNERTPVSSGNAFMWQEEAESFQSVGMYRAGRTAALSMDGSPVLLSGASLHPSVFAVLGVAPVLGRSLVESDATSGDRVLVLGHSAWQTYFGGRTDVIGETAVLDGVSHTVVGVMPEGFDFPATGADAWVPLAEGSLGMERGDFGDHTLSAVGRMRPGVSVEAAEAELATFSLRRAQDDPSAEGWGVNAVPLHQEVTASSSLLLTALLAGAVLVLLVGCANVANLLLARGFRRRTEISIRGAIGAGRPRIVRQLLAENLLLAVVGGGAGVLLSLLILDAFVAGAPAGLPLLDRASIDGRILVFSLVLSLGCVLLFGLAPALRQAGTAPQTALRGSRGSVGPGHGRLRGAILSTQVALAVVLLVSAGLFVRTFQSLATTDLGFEEDEVATLSFVLPMSRYTETESQTRLVEQLVERVEAVPGVAAATEAMRPPGSSGLMSTPFVMEGRESPNPDGRFDPEDVRFVWADYFEVMGQEMVQGRGITAEDRADSRRVIVVNEAFAAKLWPDGDAIGRRIAHPNIQQRGEWQEVVGVVANTRLDGMDQPPVPRVFVPYAQHDMPWQSWGTVLARLAPGADLASVNQGMLGALAEVDPALAPRALSTIEDAYRSGISQRAFAMALALGFALSALLLCVFGLYGLISFTVARRKREIGLRVALGAESLDIFATVVRKALILAAVGTAAGLAISLLATRTVESMLYGIERVDGVTYLATTVTVAIVAIAAATLPAWRAARADPVAALSAE